MKNQLLFLLVTLLCLNCHSQISFEKGYYIDNNDQRINCLIKNMDWKNNPTEFEFKLLENSQPEKATITSVKEFGVDNISKYIRSTVNMDRSIDNVNSLILISKQKNPEFQLEELFLKVLVEGKATLYSYEQSNLKRFFHQKESSKMEQLVYKKYLNTEKNRIAINKEYKQQLWNDLKCPTFKMSTVENVGYDKKELIRFFVAYNKCNNQESINYEEKQNKDLFNLTLRPGFNSSSLSIENSVMNDRDFDFGNEMGFRFGLEAELILSFNKNKWGVIIEPTYRQDYKSEKSRETSNVSGGIIVSKVNYKSIELPIGIRHYFYLNDNSKIFVNLSYVFDFASNSSIVFLRNNGLELDELEMRTNNNLAFGLGYKHNDRYGIEFRYHTSRDVLGGHPTWSSAYNTASLIFGYSLF